MMGGAVFLPWVVFWPDASQHWSLQAVARGQVLVPKTQAGYLPLSRVHVDEHSQICLPPAFMIPERATVAACPADPPNQQVMTPM